MLIVVCLVGLLLYPVSAAQGQPNLVGEQQPSAMGGIRFDSQSGSFGRQYVGTASLDPTIIPLPVGRNRYIRGTLLDVAAGTRFRSNGSSDLHWRFSFFDVDACTHNEKLDWVLDNPADSGTPLLGESLWRTRTGLTLFDYNTISTPTLDLRWIELRLGGELDLPAGNRMVLDIAATGAGGLASLRPGVEGYPKLGDAAGELMVGGQVGGDISLEFRYLPWKQLLGFLALDAHERTLFAQSMVHRLTIGGGVHFLVRTITPNWGGGRPFHGEGLVFFVRIEREEAFLGDRSQSIDRVQAGIQYGMGDY
jgi:hypothetical protein